MNKLIWGIGRLVCFLALLHVGCPVAKADEVPGSGSPKVELSTRRHNAVQLAADPASLIFAALRPSTHLAWKPSVNNDRFRGDKSVVEIYKRVAPATVLVWQQFPRFYVHGTGFVLTNGGWIITNYHVIADALPDEETGAQEVTINFGVYRDGQMRLLDEEVPALVYKTSRGKDLALLKLSHIPRTSQPLPTVKLAAKAPPTGSPCIVIGHPTAGALWTVRSGEVANIVQWPSETTDKVVELLTLEAADRDRAKSVLAQANPIKSVYSSCPLNPGDSGGPLVNMEGELIAVSFAGSADPSVDRFGYHIHLDELQTFIEELPIRPALYVPDAWPDAYLRQVADLDGDSYPDAMIYIVKDNENRPLPVAVLADLDQDSLRKFGVDEIRNAGPHGGWDFEFAWHRDPTRRTFWDANNDGQIDLILIDADEDSASRADHAREKSSGKWTKTHPQRRGIFDDQPLASEAMKKRYRIVRDTIPKSL